MTTTRDGTPLGRRRLDTDFALLSLLVTAALVVRCLVIARPLEVIDNLTLPDDAYLSLTIARNIARGLGPLYGTAFTNGFQPLYVFLMAPVYAVVPNDPYIPVKVALLLLAAFDAATIVVLWKLLRLYSDNVLTRVVGCALWALSSHVIAIALNGLETAIASFFLIAMIFTFERSRLSGAGRIGIRTATLLGVLSGLAMLARIDSVLLAGIIGIGLLVQLRSTRTPMRSTCAVLVAFSTAILVTMLPWLLYSHYYTGLFYPISGRAVRLIALDHAAPGQSWYLDMLGYALLAVGLNNTTIWTIALIAIAIVVVGIVAYPDRRAVVSTAARIWANRLVVPLAFAVAVCLAYGLYIFGVWFFERYMHPVSLAAVIVASALTDLALTAMPSSKRAAIAGSLVLVCAIALSLAEPRFRRLFLSTDTTTTGYMNLGLWAKRTFPDGTRIGSGQSGGLGYFADNLVVFNLDGVVNQDCYRSLVENRNLDYIRGERVAFIVGWPDNMALIANHSTGVAATDLEYLGTIEGFHSWGISWQLFRVTYPGSRSSFPAS